jgi:hypothetical protein
MPSPESPASRITTRSSETTLLTSPPGAELLGTRDGSVAVMPVIPPPTEVTCVRARAGVDPDTMI